MKAKNFDEKFDAGDQALAGRAFRAANTGGLMQKLPRKS